MPFRLPELESMTHEELMASLPRVSRYACFMNDMACWANRATSTDKGYKLFHSVSLNTQNYGLLLCGNSLDPDLPFDETALRQADRTLWAASSAIRRSEGHAGLYPQIHHKTLLQTLCLYDTARDVYARLMDVPSVKSKYARLHIWGGRVYHSNQIWPNLWADLMSTEPVWDAAFPPIPPSEARTVSEAHGGIDDTLIEAYFEAVWAVLQRDRDAWNTHMMEHGKAYDGHTNRWNIPDDFRFNPHSMR